jgi:hypothetical protein
MKVLKESQLAVKWANNQWTYYRVEKHRIWENLINSYVNLPNFRFAILYEYNKETKQRGNKIGYFDRYKSELNV